MDDIDSIDSDQVPGTTAGASDDNYLRDRGVFQAVSASIGGFVALPGWWVWVSMKQLVDQGQAPYASRLPGLLFAAVLTNIAVGGAVVWVAADHADTVWLRRTVATMSAVAWTFGAEAIVLALVALGS